MPPIRELPEGVWTRIAAGEVVERPASAVKELVENALDAGAKRVRVRLWDGGRLRIVVEDDGCGIAFEDLPLALTPHATSKITGVEDLDSIRTLGYRGEALASLTAVARVEIRSRAAGRETGGMIRASEGRAAEPVPVSCPPGTRVQVDELFGNLPARRKFLKSAAGELRRAAVFLREYAVCRPDVAFTLDHDGREVFSTDGAGDTLRVLTRLWGTPPDIRTAKAASGHLSLECWQQSRPGVRGATTRSDIMAFVNGRAVNDPAVKGAVAAAARETAGNWALFLTLDPSLVDVNIHPAKAEVRFRYPGEVFEAVREAAAQFGGPVSLSVDAGLDSPVSSVSTARATTVARGWDFRDGPKPPVSSPHAARPAGPARRFSEEPPPSRSPFSRIEPPPFDGSPGPISQPLQPVLPVTEGPGGDTPVCMGQSSGGYLVFDAPEGLVLMDPHAAHERVEYERIRARMSGGGEAAVQPLLVPVPLPPTLALEAEEYQDALRGAGFGLEMKEGGVWLTAVPSLSVGASEPETLLRSSLAALRAGHDGGAREILWRAWATMACKAAVKLTTELSRDEGLTLWRDLHACEQPFSCPHGRPTLLTLKNADLVKHFGRE